MGCFYELVDYVRGGQLWVKVQSGLSSERVGQGSC